MEEKQKALDLLFSHLDTVDTHLDKLKTEIDQEKKVPITNQTEIDLITDKNSDNALPDELAKEEGIPISTTNPFATEDLISSHNSDRALTTEDKPFTNTEEIDVLSTYNTSHFMS